MIPRRPFAALVALLLARPAAAQVRPVSAEAGVARVSFRASLPDSAPGFLPLAASPALLVAPSAARSASLAAPLAAAPAAAAAAPAAVAPALASPPASLTPTLTAPSAPALAAPLRERETAASRLPLREAAFERSPERTLGALFDGSASRPDFLAASDGPEAAPPAPRPLPRPGRWRRAAAFVGYAVPAAVVVGVAGAVAPHAAMTAAHWIGQAAYWLANPFAFMFTMPQIHKMLSRRSADVSAGMITIGLAAAVVTTANFAYDGKDLMMYRNLAQALGFAAMLFLHRRYARTPGAPPSRRRALIETGLLGLGLTALMLAAGPALMAAVPGVALMGSLLVPFQVASGFGFTYLMYAQLTRMRRANSAGDSSPAMMWAFLGTKTIWVWSLATMISLATAPAWLTLPAAAGFAALCWLAGRAALSRLLKAPWSFLPEKLAFAGRTLTRERLVDVGSFAALSALILALSAAGYFAFVDVLGVPAAVAPRFAMYLLYMVQSLVACVATLKTIQIGKRFAGNRPIS